MELDHLDRIEEINQFKKQVIHDEASASVDISNLDVSRELEISREEFKRKLQIMDMMCVRNKDGNKLSGGFVSCSLESRKNKESTYKLWTEEGAALTIQLSEYNGNLFYFGTRGSPTRILTGQNVVEVKDVKDMERVGRVAKKLGCTDFEARTIMAFSMIRKTVKESVGMDMFTHNELQDIKARKLNMATVGFATYWDFGKDRDEILHLLGYLGSYKVSMGKDSFDLVRMIGSIGCKTWRKVVEGGYQGPNQGVLITKYSQESKGNKMFSQMLYLKDEEIVSKKNEHNARVVERMGIGVASAFKERLVRIDNVFYKDYLAKWVQSYREAAGLGSLPTKHLMLRDAAGMLNDSDLVRDMCKVGANEVGMRLLLQAPTMTQLNNLELSEDEAKLVALWKEKCRVRIESNKSGKVLKWDSVLGTNPGYRDIARKLYAEHFLDLTVPYDFYVSLNEARAKYFMTSEERLALSHEMQGEEDVYCKIDVGQVKNRLRVEVNRMLDVLRRNVELTTSTNKKQIMARHTE